MVDSTLYPFSESVYQGLEASGVGNTSYGRSILPPREEQKTGPSAETIDAFKSAAVKYGVPADVLMSMAEKDSNFNEFNRSRGPGPKVRGIINVSDEEVARRDGGNPYDPAQNIDTAARKLRSYMDAGMSIRDAIKAHVGGVDSSKWGADVDAYEQDVLSRTQRIAETYISEAKPLVLETEGKPNVDQLRQAFNIEEEKKDRPNIAMQAVGDVQRGLYNVGNTAIGLGAIAADVAGFEDASTALAKRFVLNSKLNDALNPETIGSYKNIRTDEVGNFVSDAGRYAVEAVFENLPQMAASMGAGAIGAQLGRRAAEKIVTGIVEKQVAAGASQAAAEQMAAKIVAQHMGVGAAAGAMGASTGMEAADIYGDVYEKTGQRAPGTALAFGAAAGALDAFESVTALRAIAGDSVTNAIKGALVKRLGVEGAKQFAIEAGTEGLQTIVENAAVTATDGRKLFTPELADQVIDSMLKGGIAGGVTGVATQGVSEMRGGEPVAPPPSPQDQRREPTIDGGVTTAPEGAAPVVEPQTRGDVSPAAMTEAARDLAAGAPGRQTVSEVEQPAPAQPATARPGGEGPLSRVLNTGAPEVAPLATFAGERVTVSDEMGSLTGAVVSQDADGVLFKSDDGAEFLIDNQEISSGKVSIAKGGEAPVSQAPAPEPAPAPVASKETPVSETQTALPSTEGTQAAPADSDIAEQAMATITEPPVTFKRTYEDMSETELRDRMKYIAGQAKAAGGWNKMLVDERKKIEKAINAIKAPAPALPENEKPASAEQPTEAAAPAIDDNKLRWILNNTWGARPAALAAVENNGLTATHEVKDNGKGRFTVVPKAEAPTTDATQKFDEASGTLGVPRAEMPQVKSEHHGALTNFLNAKGIDHETTTVSAEELKPTQAEFSPEKVEKAKEEGNGDRAVIVSQDGHVIDGHHQWLAAKDQGEDVKAIVLKTDAATALEVTKEFPSAATAQESASPAAPPEATERWPNPEIFVGEPKDHYEGRKAVVEYMNKDIGKDELIDRLSKLDMQQGVLQSITNRVSDFLENDIQKVLKNQKARASAPAENKKPRRDASRRTQKKSKAAKAVEDSQKIARGELPIEDDRERQRLENVANLEAIEAEEAATPSKAEKKYTQIGVNRNGDPLFEDENKIRSFVADGVRQTESVLIEGGRARPRNPAARSNDFELPIAPAKPAVSENTVFTQDAYEAAKARFKARHKGTQFNSGIDPDDLRDGLEMAGFHIEKGARTFAAYAEAMLADLGENIRPYLKSWYLAVKFDPRAAAFTGMDSSAAVEAVDLASLNGEQNEPAKLDQPSAGALEGVPANAVQGATESREAGARAERSGREDTSGNDRAGSPGLSGMGSVGNGQGELSVPAGRAEPQGSRGQRASGERGGETVQRNRASQERNPARGDRGRVDSDAASGRPAKETAADFAISDEDRIGEGGQKTKYKNNVAAIRILKRLEETGEPASRADQAALAKYVGWGGIPQAFERSDGAVSKGWEKEAAELKELLTPEEYAAAAASTRNAHYTAPEIVKAMWDAMRRMGFNGGRVLEPSVGVGNFFGLMPTDLRNASALHGVELDRITGGVAKNLYPAAKITAPMGFQDFTFPDGYFDAAIGNPPFGAEKLYDPLRKDLKSFSIHNYFFAKSIDGLKPGGVLTMVVTNRMLDSMSDAARQYIAARADLVAAIRLPNNAFLKNAGTEVTTDIVILRKRKEGEKLSRETWDKVVNYTDKNGAVVPLNEYFTRHPENMLGEFGAYGSMYRPDEAALVAKEGQDTAQLLADALARLPQNITTGSAIDAKPAESGKITADVRHVRVGSMFMQGDKVMVREPDSLGETRASEAAIASEKAKERITGMIAVRDQFAALRALQLDPKANDKQIEAGRKKLNDVYDSFVKKNGFINGEANKRLMRDDPSWPQISALEDDFQKGISPAVAKSTGQKPMAPSAKKAAIFSKRTQSPFKPVTSAATANDALVDSLAERGRVDLDLMEKLYGKPREEILRELGNLVFDDPVKGPVTRDEYLSGNVKAKLAEAIEKAKTDPAYQRNVDELRAVQPADVQAIDIDVKVGSHWIPPQIMADFSRQIIGNTKVQVVYNPAMASWTIKGDASTDAATRWGTDRARPSDVLEAAANQKTITIRDKMSDGTFVLNEVATQAANDKVQAVKDEWRRWVFDEDNRRDTLASLYNEMFNTNVSRQFDGSHLTFPGKVGDDVIRLRPHQANAVWRILQSSTTLADHVVGAGKTFTLIAAAMEMRRMGLAKKPMFVVPNHLVGQWGADFIKLYPNASVLAATKRDFEAGNRKKLFARIATGDWDAVIVAHSSFGKVEVDPDAQSAFIEQQVADLLRTEEAMRAAEGKDGRNVKALQKRVATLREKQKRLLDTGAKDDSLYWKELGVDALYLDEAHEFKNLEFSTSMQRVAGLGNQQGSQKASDLYLKVRQVLEATGGRNIVFATGTPISNTMAEMFTMQRYLDGKALAEQGLNHFDAWARMYGDVVTDWELSPSGQYKLNSRFAKFVNMPELMQRYTSFADVINRDDINEQLKARGEKLPVPKIKGGKPQNIVVDRSPQQAAYIGEPNADDQYPQGSLVWRAENLPKKAEKGADNMLKIMSDARKAALDMRLIDPSYPDYAGSKVNVAADRIKAIYDKWDADKGTQLVFIDLSTPKSAVAKEAKELRDLIEKAEAGDKDAQEKLDAKSPDELLALESKFSVYDDLKEKLIDRGIPENEIAFIHSANTEQQKEELFGKVKSGRIRVLFGSTAKMGAGMNVQNRLVALHHLDAPWRPSDLEQREGRIIRQGNELYARDPDNFEVEINRYAAKATLDSRMWQTIEAKARFIEQVRKGAEGSREIEDIAGEAANAAEMKAAASGNPLVLEEMTLRQKVKKLENEERAHKQEQWGVKDRIRQNERSIEADEKTLADMRADSKLATPEEFLMTVRGETFDKRKEAGAKILEEVEELKRTGAGQTLVGSYGDFKITLVRSPHNPDSFYLAVRGKGEYTTSVFNSVSDAQGVAQRVVAAIRDARDIAGKERVVAERESMVEKLKTQIKDWPKAAELAGAKARHGEVIAALKPKPKPQPTTEEAPKASIGRGAGMSTEALADALTRGKDGPIVKAMLDSGKVVIEATGEDMPEGAQAATMPDGTVRLVASNLDASTARGVLLHEVFHSGAEALVGQDNWKGLLRRVQTAAENAKTGSWMAEAKARAEAANTPAGAMAEEIAAYAVENAENAPAGIREIADRLVGAVKAYVLRRFGKQFGQVTPGQLRALAVSALRSWKASPTTKAADGVRYSIADKEKAAPAPSKKSAFERAKDKASNFLTEMMVGKGSNLGDFSLLALAPVRPMFMELTEGMPSARNYLDVKQAMDADRNAMNVEADKILQEWTKWAGKNVEANKELMRLMHETTLEQYDPSPENRDKNAGPNPALQRAYDALPDEAKRLYSVIRDTYSERADAVEAQIIDNVKQAMGHTIRNAERKYNAEMERIKDEGLKGEERTKAEKAAKDALETVRTRGRRNKAARLKRMREYFESNRLAGPYFPLARFGNYFVTVRDEDGKIVSFSKFEKVSQQKEFADAAREVYGKDAVHESLASRKTDEERNLDPRFIATIDSILDNADIDVAVRDQVYQAYLETLPDLSIRKSRIRRKGTAGFNEDAVRAFASQMFHGAHQLARLRFGMQLQDHLAEAATEVRNAPDPVRAEAVMNEIRQAHDFIVNPSTSPLAHHMTSAVFLWTMAFNLSSAVVNASQSVTMGIPNLAFDPDTKAGIKNATRQLSNATLDFLRGKGFVGNSSKLSTDERAAMKVGYDSGLIEDSQSHDLAGVAESGIDYNPKVQKVMRMASWPMHQVERFNREITYLAAYRIARAAGMEHQKAIRKASDLTWMSHFDNQSNAKPRFMRRDLGKVLFALKAYQANIIYRTFRDLHQALNGVDEETRKTAMKRFASTFALTMGVAGIKGSFAYSTVMMIAGALMGMLGDDDDPDEKLRKAIVEKAGDSMVGRAVSGMLMDGVPGYWTGTSLSGRMGMADLWFHTNDRDFTPEERWQNYLEQFLGAGVSRAHQAYSGAVDIMRGDVEKGLEKLAPAGVGNILKANRYRSEGVRDKYGNPIVKDVPVQDLLKQVIGFTPAEIADRRARNNYQYNTQKRIKSEATEARQGVARARLNGDQVAEEKAQKKVDAFNDRYPDYAIRPKSIIQSMRAMENRSDRMEFGVDLDPKLAERVKGGTAPSIYAR
jgi:N12 class adenine-specific DNA methylase